MNSTKVSKRILALDILRGVTIAGMIMVNMKKGKTRSVGVRPFHSACRKGA